MGFDWVFINPIQKLGRSKSLYSISDYFQIDKTFVRSRSRQAPEDQVRAVVREAEGLGMRMMIDLVINHCVHRRNQTRFDSRGSQNLKK